MSKNKTVRTKADPFKFINSLPEQKRDDSLRLTEMMSKITGEEPYMYGPSIVGFGNYHYVYESGREGDAPLAGFSPRKTALTVYVSKFPGREELESKLGKHTSSKVCLYIKKLDDISVPVLKKMITGSVRQVRKKYPQR
jgi:hypothetical protein